MRARRERAGPERAGLAAIAGPGARRFRSGRECSGGLAGLVKAGRDAVSGGRARRGRVAAGHSRPGALPRAPPARYGRPRRQRRCHLAPARGLPRHLALDRARPGRHPPRHAGVAARARPGHRPLERRRPLLGLARRGGRIQRILDRGAGARDPRRRSVTQIRHTDPSLEAGREQDDVLTAVRRVEPVPPCHCVLGPECRPVEPDV